MRSAVGGLQGVTRVEVAFDVLSDQEKSGLQQKLGRGALPEGALAQVANVVCVGSGKGGVGKSTITANLAAALASQGKKVGVLDADVWGYSIPRMFGLGGRPQVSPERKILPLEAGGVKVMSIGFFVEEDSAVVWRGPMLHKALTQFLEDVEWGELDFLLVDLPPGTGDVSMTLAQLLPQSKFLLVTTPQPVAQKVARRAAEMAHKVNLEIGGVVENMAGFVTPGGERYAIFGEGGGQALADELDVPLLGKVPLTMPLREQADGGVATRRHRSRRPGRPGDRARPRAGSSRCSRSSCRSCRWRPSAAPATARESAPRPASPCRWPAERVKVLYTAEATVTGGRDAGHGRSSDGALDVQLRAPSELGGEGGGTNPEQLFAVGYAACFEGALKTVARREKLEADDVSIQSKVSLGPGEDKSFTIAVALDVTLPSMTEDQAADLVVAAHAVCPYSNATRGNIAVDLTAKAGPSGTDAPAGDGPRGQLTSRRPPVSTS